MEQIISEWHKNVYHACTVDYDLWNRIKEAVLERDGLRCQACRKRKQRKQLTAHHILPREFGGTNEMDNLITVCHRCHDYVEESGFRTWREIAGCTLYIDWDEESRKDAESHDRAARIIDDARPEWHCVVYGCGKRKARNKKK